MSERLWGEPIYNQPLHLIGQIYDPQENKDGKPNFILDVIKGDIIVFPKETY